MWLSRVKEGGGGEDWEFGICRCKLVYIGLINKVLIAHRTIFNIVINYKGKKGIYIMYNSVTLQQKLT